MRTNPELYAGDLDKRVTLLRPVYSEYQDEITGWEVVATTWASINPNYGQEINEAGHTVATTLLPIVIRYRSDIDKRWRLQYGDQVYEVEAILNPQQRRAGLQLGCKGVE